MKILATSDLHSRRDWYAWLLKQSSKYDAVFVGVGLGADSKLGVPGEDGAGVLGATAWIEEMKLAATPGKPTLGRVIVVGGGNTAVDMARECARLGARSVTMVYRRDTEAMSAYKHELASARKEGVSVMTNAVPVGFTRDASGAVTGIKLARTLGGRAVAGTEHDVACDLVGVAIGQAKVKSLAAELPGMMLDANPKVYAGGDCINGGMEVVNAVADGRDAARAMIESWELEANRG